MAHSASEILGQYGRILQAEVRKCDFHGEYTAKLMHRGDKREPLWLGCEKCADEKADAEAKAESERMARQFAADRLERKIGRAAIPPRFASKTFSDYVAQTKEQQRALKTCKDYADNFEKYRKEGKSILLLGGVGTGKTHLATAAANQIIRETKYTAVYSTASNIIRHVKSTFDRESAQSEDDVYGLYASMDLLIIDEIGVQNATEFELTVMFEIINWRYEEMKPTMVISNRGIVDLPRYLGDRVVDRLREGGGKMVPLDWESARA